MKSLDQKLANIHAAPHRATDFILADAKDADMAFGLAATGTDPVTGRRRSLAEFRDQIGEIVAQGLVDIMLMSPSTAEVLTIEGLGSIGHLHPLQESFSEQHGLQCGFCTPGMIMASYELLGRNPHPSEEEIRAGLEGNLCRCTGYQHIVEAVTRACRTALP